jgi:hypothetical protein
MAVRSNPSSISEVHIAGQEKRRTRIKLCVAVRSAFVRSKVGANTVRDVSRPADADLLRVRQTYVQGVERIRDICD